MKIFEIVNKKLGTNYNSDAEIKWHYISMYQKLSGDFIREFADEVDWNYISKYQKLSGDFIREFADEVDWNYISKYQKLSENFIREFADKVDWRYISEYQKLSEDFIREFANKVDWYYISVYQKLSEDFIREFADKADWQYICIYQKLSESFIREFSDRVDWYTVSIYQKLSDSFISEFKGRLDMKAIKDNWIYKSAEEKKILVQETGEYECYDDYFVAYKAIREDRYSLYNFQYKYEPNAEYESWCDCSDNENSFGLSVGTYNYAKGYLNDTHGKIVRCKVKYEDIGRIVYDREKIRCFKITPIE